MSTQTVSLGPLYWISGVVTGTFCTGIHIILLKKEINKRRSGDAIFTTKYLKIWSILCIISGFIAAFGAASYFIDGFCYINRWVWMISLYNQYVFMGFYQLSRLYYSFANDKIHSKKGYPNYIFIIMFTVGIIFMITIYPFHASHVVTHCGIGDKLVYHEQVKISTVDIEGFYFSVITFGGALIWDFITLALYAFKIRVLYQARKNMVTSSNAYSPSQVENDQVQTRILSILYKIAIITLFYEFVFFMVLSFVTIAAELKVTWLYYVSFCLSNDIPILTLTFCMFIMMDHNHGTYGRFLRILYVTKLYWIGCCCCRYMVIQQVNEMNKEMTMHLKSDNGKKRASITEETVYNVSAHDIKPSHAKIEVRKIGSELETIDDDIDCNQRVSDVKL